MTDIVKFQFERPELTRPKEYTARVVYSEWLTPDTLKIAFEPTSEPMFRFEAGQYVSIVLPKDEAAGLRKELRPYSMWNHPDEFEYAVTIVKMVEGGRCTSLLRTLGEGDEVTFVGPLGSFFLRRPLHHHLTFVATGTGLVPMRAMVKELISTGEINDRDVTLYFGVRSEEDLFETAELQRWNDRFPRFHFIPTLSRPGEGWTGARGRVTAHLEATDFPVDDMQIYLCGNGAMIDDVVKLMEARGLHRRTRRLVLEKYFT
jgi:CDP-4-dehydro-6-deoxyglucose reductase, E3